MDIYIKNEPIENSAKIMLDKINWGFTQYTPEVYAKLVYGKKGFDIEFTVFESNPLREITNHQGNVSGDSCVEFFVKFDPENSDEYINFEVNANGAMRADIRTDRANYKHLDLSDIEAMKIKTDITDTYWTASYTVSETLIKKYYPLFSMDKCRYLLGNFYKCGSNTAHRHYLTVFELKCEKPDFHRQEYFGKINLV